MVNWKQKLAEAQAKARAHSPIGAQHQAIRDQLAILRQTRSQRTLEPLIVPPHLRDTGPARDPALAGFGDAETDAGVERRGDVPPLRHEDS